MRQRDFENIKTLTMKIEQALLDSNFTELSSLSSRLQSIVEEFTQNTAKNAVKNKDLEMVENLLAKVRKYRVETELKFKDYSLKISQQTKMHNAYKDG